MATPILRDDLGEGNCESKIAARRWGVNFLPRGIKMPRRALWEQGQLRLVLASACLRNSTYIHIFVVLMWGSLCFHSRAGDCLTDREENSEAVTAKKTSSSSMCVFWLSWFDTECKTACDRLRFPRCDRSRYRLLSGMSKRQQLKTTPTPDKNGSYGIKVGVRMP